MAEKLPEYQYVPLQPDEIRLLYCSVSETDEVTWTLEAAQLFTQDSDQAPLEYDVLSYTWGSLHETFPFTCNGQELRIHNNLKNALPYLARRNSALPIWIDAVCINQNDDVEKVHQIAIMHKIYRQASMAWVWLEPLYDTAIISMLRQLASVSPNLNRVRREGKTCDPVSIGLPGVTSPLWNDINKIISHQWFSRLWIVQEAALAPRIKFICGLIEIAWADLEGVIENVVDIRYGLQDEAGGRVPITIPDTTDPNVVFLLRAKETMWNKRTEWAERLLLTLHLTSRNHFCFDAHDRVFGVMGFVDEERIPQLAISRQPSMEELYTRLTHMALAAGTPTKLRWWLLLASSETMNKLPGLPSWVPDYHNVNMHNINSPPEELSNTLKSMLKNKSRIKPSRGTTTPQQTASFKVLVVHGKVFDLVDFVYDEMPDQDFWLRGAPLRSLSLVQRGALFGRFVAWEAGVRQEIFGRSHVSGAGMPIEPEKVYATASPEMTDSIYYKPASLDDYWRTLLGDRVERTDMQMTYEGFCSFLSVTHRWANLLDRMEADYPNEDEEMSPRDEETLSLAGRNGPLPNWLPAITDLQMKRRLFTTKDGRIGFGPSYMRPGDEVCILDNAFTAHVLRKAGDTAELDDDKIELESAPKETHILVGQAYVHNMMNGQVESLGLESQDFYLV